MCVAFMMPIKINSPLNLVLGRQLVTTMIDDHILEPD